MRKLKFRDSKALNFTELAFEPRSFWCQSFYRTPEPVTNRAWHIGTALPIFVKWVNGMNKWNSHVRMRKLVSCNVDYTSVVEGGSLNGGTGCSATGSLIFTEHLLCAKCFNTLQDNPLEVSINILTTRHSGWPCIGSWGWQIILRHPQSKCRRKICKTLHTTDRAIWGFNLPTLFSCSSTTSNPSGIRFLWLWGC